MARETCNHRYPVGAGFAREQPVMAVMFASEARSCGYLHVIGSIGSREEGPQGRNPGCGPGPGFRCAASGLRGFCLPVGSLS